MFDFNIYVPTDLVYGKDCHKRVGELMKPFARKVLLLYGSERIFKSGTGNEIVESLEAAAIEVVKLGGVKPNADTDYIDMAIKKAREEGIDGLISVGGGSVTDTAKAVSAGIFYPGPVKEIFLNPKVEVSRFLPIGVVVTMPATASESNGMAVVMESDTHLKLPREFRDVKPKFALLNPELSVGISPYQTASGGFDIFSHAFERYVDERRGSSVLEAMSLMLMKETLETIPKALKEPENAHYRGEMLIAANLAHNDMIGPGGDFACHGISHTVTSYFGTPHGAALAMIIPAWVEQMYSHNPKKISKLVQFVFGAQGEEPEVIVKDGIKRMKEYVKSIGLDNVIKVDDIKAVDFEKLSQESLGPFEFLGGGFGKTTKEDIISILEKIIVA